MADAEKAEDQEPALKRPACAAAQAFRGLGFRV